VSEAIFEAAGPVASLTFNRPEARNAMTWAMYQALADACDRVDADEGARVFVLRGARNAFVAGTDIRQFTEFRSGEDGVAYERRMEDVLDRLERVRVPTIAQIEGVAAGGGCIIACACDLRVCTPAATFGVPIARTLGNCLSTANHSRLAELIGPARTKDLMFTGRLMHASEAAAAGLVSRLVAAEDIDREVRDLAATIASMAPLTLRTTKEAIRRIVRQQRLAPAASDDLISGVYGSADFREGVAAFVEKRTPRFTGR
jgi:enoyl-CoA hydratase/carnithine racemase